MFIIVKFTFSPQVPFFSLSFLIKVSLRVVLFKKFDDLVKYTTQNNIKNQYFENIVSEHLLDYVKYEKLALFKISTLHRILTKYKLKNGSLENQKIYDFLFEIIFSSKNLFGIFGKYSLGTSKAKLLANN